MAYLSCTSSAFLLQGLEQRHGGLQPPLPLASPPTSPSLPWPSPYIAYLDWSFHAPILVALLVLSSPCFAAPASHGQSLPY